MNIVAVEIPTSRREPGSRKYKTTLDAIFETNGKRAISILDIPPYATGYSPQNVSNIVSKLNGASLIVKNGDRISLRTL